MNNILFICWATLFLYISLDTEAIPSWGRLFRMQKLLKLDDYERQCSILGNLSYPSFIRSKYNGFWVKLLSCQECLCVWINLIAFIFFSSALGGWAYFGANTLGLLAFCAAFKAFLKKMYE